MSFRFLVLRGLRILVQATLAHGYPSTWAHPSRIEMEEWLGDADAYASKEQS